MFTIDKEGGISKAQPLVYVKGRLKNLRLQVLLCENHHLLIGHLGEK